MSKTIKGRLKNLDKYIQNKWDEYYWNFLMKYEDILDWHSISRNPNITMEMTEEQIARAEIEKREEEILEQDRLERLRRHDNLTAKHYGTVHQSMLGYQNNPDMNR